MAFLLPSSLLPLLVLGALVNYILGQLVVKTGLSGTDRLLGLCLGCYSRRANCERLAVFGCFHRLAQHPMVEGLCASARIWRCHSMVFDYLENTSSFVPKL